jgi:hypothetical protein
MRALTTHVLWDKWRQLNSMIFQFRLLLLLGLHNCNLYPPHRTILEAKYRRYSDAADIVTIEFRAEVKLQDLFNHTAKRILLFCK